MNAKLPNQQDFMKHARLATAPRLMPVVRTMLADTLTPVLAYRRLVHGDDRMQPSFLLESVVDGNRQGQYSYLGTRPRQELIARGHDITHITHHPQPQTQSWVSDNPLHEPILRDVAEQPMKLPDLPDFTGGWVGLVGYDTIRYLEPEKLNNAPSDDRHLPDIHLQLYLDMIAFNHAQKTLLLITHVQVGPEIDLEAAYHEAITHLDQLENALARHETSSSPDLPIPAVNLKPAPPTLSKSNMSEGGYQEAVVQCKKYIAAGDAFQIVPSQRFELQTQADPFDIYRALRVVNPSPYMFYLQIDGAMLVGSSPEILCRVQEGQATTRPLAGTRHRGQTPEEDLALEQELKADPKDQAEHIMLVDLHRNDIGRVAQPGSIELSHLMEVERYSHVMHLSSTVTGQLCKEMDCWEALRVSLPVGTVSGAPKVRAMQIIDEMEPTRRGPYAGAVGYADLAGNMDMAIALRTMVIMPQQDAWQVHIQAGAGIVADSDPDLEHQETVNKAAALAKAVQVAEQAFTRSDSV